jgi:hypothetical protein
MGPNMANTVDGPISISNFGQKLPDSKHIMTRGSHDAKSKHQAKVPDFSVEKPHVTLPIFPNANNAGSVSGLVQET